MKYCYCFFFLLLITGCSVKYPSSSKLEDKSFNNIRKLAHAIIKLDESIDKQEAAKVATLAIQYSKVLAKEYDLVSPPLWHNTLINMNLKKRGFCYHFAQDMLKELKRHHIQSMDLHWVTHKKNEYWEHNAVLIKGRNQPYTKGIILDAWRNSGELYWNYLEKDKQYNWQYDYEKSRYFGN